VLYGEVYGSKVQSLTYGLENRNVAFAAFAALDNGRWLDTLELFVSLDTAGVERVPYLYAGAYDLNEIKKLAEGDSQMPRAPKGAMMEGVVIVPKAERRDANIGRVCLKHISNRYWTLND
jgi:RNA ligase